MRMPLGKTKIFPYNTYVKIVLHTCDEDCDCDWQKIRALRNYDCLKTKTKKKKTKSQWTEHCVYSMDANQSCFLQTSTIIAFGCVCCTKSEKECAKWKAAYVGIKNDYVNLRWLSNEITVNRVDCWRQKWTCAFYILIFPDWISKCRNGIAAKEKKIIIISIFGLRLKAINTGHADESARINHISYPTRCEQKTKSFFRNDARKYTFVAAEKLRQYMHKMEMKSTRAHFNFKPDDVSCTWRRYDKKHHH